MTGEDQSGGRAWGDWAAMAGFGLVASAAFVPVHPLILVIAGFGLIYFGIFRKHKYLSYMALVLAGAFCFLQAPPYYVFVWPVPLLICFATLIGVWYCQRHSTSPTPPFIRLGTLSFQDFCLALAISAVSVVILLIWFRLTDPDVSNLSEQIPDIGPLAMVGLAIVFSIVNAVLEETVWRGAIQSWLTTIISAPAAILLQAISFGAPHLHGFPNGILGIFLATCYGVLLGALAQKTNGLAAPLAAHIFTDLAIFYILLSLV